MQAIATTTPSTAEMNFEKYFFGEREVIIFVDESGDPTLNDPGNPLFLLGACLVTGQQLNARLREPWLGVRETILGQRDRALHMREAGRRLNDKHISTLIEFFDRATFKRLSFCVSDQTLFELGEIPRAPILEMSLEFLLSAAAELTFGDSYIDGFSVIFEQGPLAERMRQFLPRRRLHRQDGEGIVSSVPVNWAFVGKDADEPGLEVADFIAHTAAGHTRSKTRLKFEPRFNSVFPKSRPELCKSLVLESAIFQSSNGGTPGS